jgi:ankyrin repeat protein
MARMRRLFHAWEHRPRVILAAALLFLAACAEDVTVSSSDPSLELLSAVQNGDEATVAELVAKGANVNAEEADGTTALMRAIHGGFPAIAARLIAAGADVDATNDYGVSPLYLAAITADASTTRALLSAGADANEALFDREPVLITAAKAGNENVVEVLLTGGNELLTLAELASESAAAANALSSGYQAAANPASPANRAGIEARDGWYGQTALLVAAAGDHSEVVRLLVNAGADIDATSWSGNTALHSAAARGATSAITTLIELGARVDVRNASGQTPLDIALESGQGEDDDAVALLRRLSAESKS